MSIIHKKARKTILVLGVCLRANPTLSQRNLHPYQNSGIQDEYRGKYSEALSNQASNSEMLEQKAFWVIEYPSIKAVKNILDLHGFLVNHMMIKVLVYLWLLEWL